MHERLEKERTACEPSTARDRRPVSEVAAVLLVLLALLACKQGGDDGSVSATASATAVPVVVPSAVGVAASATTAAPAISASLPAIPARDVAAGEVAADGPWLPAFRVGRAEHDAGLTWSAARRVCQARDQDLCTVPQWRRACRIDSALGNVASWTLGARDASGFVVRGGAGCDAATVAGGSQVESARVGLCCSRAIAVDTTNRHPAFLRAVSGQLLRLERALNAHSAPSLGALVDESVTYYALRDAPKAVALDRFAAAFRQYPDETTTHGTCVVTLQLLGHVSRDQWIGECDKVVDRGDAVAVVTARYVFGGPEAKLRSVTEPRILRNWSAP